MILNPRDLAIALVVAILANVVVARRTGTWNWSCLGLGLLVMIPVYNVAGYGTRWEFGPRYGMPKALVAPDGQHFQDGTVIDDFTLAAIRDDHEEEADLCIYGAGALMLASLAGMVYRDYRRELHKLKLAILSGMIRKALAKDDWQEADYLRDRYAEAAITGRPTWPKQLRLPDVPNRDRDPRTDGAATA